VLGSGAAGRLGCGSAACSLLAVGFYGDAGKYAHGGEREEGGGRRREKGRAAQRNFIRGKIVGSSRVRSWSSRVESPVLLAKMGRVIWGLEVSSVLVGTQRFSRWSGMDDTRGPARMGPGSRRQACGWCFGLRCFKGGMGGTQVSHVARCFHVRSLEASEALHLPRACF
jgi:hypothetical protein